MRIAQNVDSYLPISLPLFCEGLHVLPPHELMARCRLQDKTLKNLALEAPKYRKHWVVRVPSLKGVAEVEVLPGGRYAFFILDDDEVQLWDIKSPSGGTAKRLGRLLASYQFPWAVEMYEYQISPEDRKVIFATVSRAS